MISSALMDGCYLQCVIIFCCFLYLISDALSASGRSKTLALMKAADGQKSDVLRRRTGNVSSNIGSGKRLSLL